MHFATFSSLMVLSSQIYLSVATAVGSSSKVKTESKCTQLNTAAHAPDTWDYFIQLKMSEIAQTDEGIIEIKDAPTELRREMLIIFQNCEGIHDLDEDKIKVRCTDDNCFVSTTIPSRCPPWVLKRELNSEILDYRKGHSINCDTLNTCTKAVLQLKLGVPSTAPISDTAPHAYRIERWGGGTVWQIRLHGAFYMEEDFKRSICNDIWDTLASTTLCKPFPEPFPRECDWNYRSESAHEEFIGEALVIRAVFSDSCDREARQQEIKQSIEQVITRHGIILNGLYCADPKNQQSIQDTNDMWLRPYGERIQSYAQNFRENGGN